jgi:alpha-aminoadipate/glutamate carrier protein LysW
LRTAPSWTPASNRQGKKEDQMIACPECAADVELNGVIVGEIVQCEDCSAELEILSVNPVEVGLAPAEEEDWGE